MVRRRISAGRYALHLTYQKLQYIHQNPVQEGWVEEAHHYFYSSARDFSGLPGLVPISLTN